MESTFFYSADGSRIEGPVSEGVLRQLARDQVLRPGSFLRRTGEIEWRPIIPLVFQAMIAVPPGPPPPLPAPAPAPVAPAPPPSPLLPRETEFSPEPEFDSDSEPSRSWADFLGQNSIRLALMAGAAFVALGTAFWVTRVSPRPPHVDVLGAFTAALLAILTLPYLVSWIFRQPYRLAIRTAGILVMALLIWVGKSLELELASDRANAAAEQISGNVSNEARKELRTKGYYSGDTADSEKNLQKLQSQLQGNSDSSRLGRDLLKVSAAMLAKAKVSQAAEVAYHFDPITITSLNDIAVHRAALVRLRDTQVDMITFLQNFDAHGRAALADDGFTPSTINQAVASFRKGGHVDQVTVFWQKKVQFTDDHLARLDLLANNWGHWHVVGGQMLFDDGLTLAAYKAIFYDLQQDLKEIQDLQKQIFQ